MPFVLTRDCGVRAEHHGLQALSVTFVQILAQQVPPCDGALETASVRMKGPSCGCYAVRSYPRLWCECGRSWLTSTVGYFVQILAQATACDGALETASVRMKGPSCGYYAVRSYLGLWFECGTS